MKVIDHPKPIPGTERSACPLYAPHPPLASGRQEVCIRQGWRLVPVGYVLPEDLSDPATLASLAAAGRQMADIVPPDYSDEPPGVEASVCGDAGQVLPDVIRHAWKGETLARIKDSASNLQDERDGAFLAAHVAAYLKQAPEHRADGGFIRDVMMRLLASGDEGSRHLVGFSAALERYIAMGAAGVDVWQDYRDHANSWMILAADVEASHLTATKEIAA